MSNQLTVEQFKRVLPPQVKRAVDQDLVDTVNNLVCDSEFKEAYRDNILGYVGVMAEGKFKIENYLSAVRYVSYKLMGDTNIAAYTKTFPDKYQRFLNEGVAAKDIASYVTAYNKSKLVNLIYGQSIIPSYILNQDLYQKALNVQAELMVSANSEKVRTDAANSILTQLKMPETQKVQLEVGVKEDRGITALRESTMALVAQQREMLKAGAMNAHDVANSKLVLEGEYEEVVNP
jgi:hypothetical protein